MDTEVVETLTACTLNPGNVAKTDLTGSWAPNGGWELVDALLTAPGLRPAYVRMSSAAGPINGRKYSQASHSPSGALVETVDLDAVVDLFAGGATLIFDAVEALLPDISAVATNLQMQLDYSAVRVGVFATPGSTRGLPAHTDPVDVIVVQVAGHKHWTTWDRVAGGTRTARTFHDNAPAGKPRTFTLHEGDAVFIPAGTPHRAECLDSDGSVHLSICLHPYTVSDRLAAVVKRAAEDAGIDYDAAIDSVNEDCLRNLLTAAAEYTDLPVGGGTNRRQSLRDVAELTADDKVSRTNTPLQYSESSDQNRVQLIGPRLTLAVHRGVIEALTSLPPDTDINVGDLLPALPAERCRRIAQALIRAGILRRNRAHPTTGYRPHPVRSAS